MSQANVNLRWLLPLGGAAPLAEPSTDQSRSDALVEVSASKSTGPATVTSFGVPETFGASRRTTVGPRPPTGFETSDVCLTVSVTPPCFQVSVTAMRL